MLALRARICGAAVQQPRKATHACCFIQQRLQWTRKSLMQTRSLSSTLSPPYTGVSLPDLYHQQNRVPPTIKKIHASPVVRNAQEDISCVLKGDAHAPSLYCARLTRRPDLWTMRAMSVQTGGVTDMCVGDFFYMTATALLTNNRSSVWLR